jgi:hypothetical protein
VLIATLAGRLGIERLAGRFVVLRRDLPGAANVGRKAMALIYAMLLGADSIDDCEVLRAGRTRRLLGGCLAAPSTLGTFLRAFTFGHVRQFDRLLAETLTRAWAAGAGTGAGRLVVDVDSFAGEVHGYQKQGVGFGYTKRRGYHPLMASGAGTGEVLIKRPVSAGCLYSISIRVQKAIDTGIAATPELDWITLADYPKDGEAQIAETLHDGQRTIVRRTRLIGAQAELWSDWRYFPFLTNRTESILIVEAEHLWTLHLPARWPW